MAYISGKKHIFFDSLLDAQNFSIKPDGTYSIKKTSGTYEPSTEIPGGGIEPDPGDELVAGAEGMSQDFTLGYNMENIDYIGNLGVKKLFNFGSVGADGDLSPLVGGNPSRGVLNSQGAMDTLGNTYISADALPQTDITDPDNKSHTSFLVTRVNRDDLTTDVLYSNIEFGTGSFLYRWAVPSRKNSNTKTDFHFVFGDTVFAEITKSGGEIYNKPIIWISTYDSGSNEYRVYLASFDTGFLLKGAESATNLAESGFFFLGASNQNPSRTTIPQNFYAYYHYNRSMAIDEIFQNASFLVNKYSIPHRIDDIKDFMTINLASFSFGADNPIPFESVSGSPSQFESLGTAGTFEFPLDGKYYCSVSLRLENSSAANLEGYIYASIDGVRVPSLEKFLVNSTGGTKIAGANFSGIVEGIKDEVLDIRTIIDIGGPSQILNIIGNFQIHAI